MIESKRILSVIIYEQNRQYWNYLAKKYGHFVVQNSTQIVYLKLILGIVEYFTNDDNIIIISSVTVA